ncbi:hypothetical protein K505DRAFT_421536 [Melanomma pulvis-pyrius CBS 109.77]|uniref:Uncharacterized protein n=1 Tax=Melanomma pulvis-pyrius CBS 109.77 TaxID=1314802 RepID=A0A6A6WVP4_9PLEO|nr:hypothetical protein K505DRAFT_421536 [Melanomma pulvis-pyrius CBS 109.77]
MTVLRDVRRFLKDRLSLASEGRQKYYTTHDAHTSVYTSAPTTGASQIQHPSSLNTPKNRWSTPASYNPRVSAVQENPPLTLDSPGPNSGVPLVLYISSHPILPLQSLPASQYVFLKIEDFLNEKRLKTLVGMGNKGEEMGSGTETPEMGVATMCSAGLALNPLNGLSVESGYPIIFPPQTRTMSLFPRCMIDLGVAVGFFENMEESTLNIRAHPILQRPKPPVLHDKYPLCHMPRNYAVVVIRRGTKEVYVRKTDGKVYRVKVKENGDKGSREKTVPTEVFGDDEGWEMVEHYGDEDDVVAAAVRRKVGCGSAVEKGWDVCAV